MANKESITNRVGDMTKHFGSDFNEFYIECLENYIKYLEDKLKDIECGECYKNMLDCKCNGE